MLPASPLQVAYHPPRSARSLAAELTLAPGPTLELALADGDTVAYHARAARLLPPIGRTERLIRFADGAQCRVLAGQEAAFATLEAAIARRPLQTWIHRLENNLKGIALATLLTVLALWVAYQFGLPAVADHLARQSSPQIRHFVSEQSMTLLEKQFLRPSGLDAADQATLRRLAAEVEATLPAPLTLTLETRSSRIGPNAFALPDGRIIFTDELFALLENEAQMLAVIAHEAGHVEAQHGMRLVIQNTGLALALNLLFGDLSAWGGVASTLPVVLAQSAYSREFETAADLHAAHFLLAADLGVAPLREALLHLHADRPGIPAEDLLSSHPSLRSRLEALDALAETPGG